jgi:hypothetical protein
MILMRTQRGPKKAKEASKEAKEKAKKRKDERNFLRRAI